METSRQAVQVLETYDVNGALREGESTPFDVLNRETPLHEDDRRVKWDHSRHGTGHLTTTIERGIVHPSSRLAAQVLDWKDRGKTVVAIKTEHLAELAEWIATFADGADLSLPSVTELRDTLEGAAQAASVPA
jgi:hypothetical protein